MALRGRACHLTNRTANGSKPHFTGREAFLIQSEPKRSLLGGLVKSPNRWRWLAHGVKRNRRGTFHDAMMQTDYTQVFFFPPAPKGHNKIAQGKAKRRPERVFFPTVAWPSEAVRAT